ncbi:MAG: hypothetical protein LBV43_13570 [Prevotella sp.]|jgi:hypothetical protein|nr:hypothetical protein [Prevotella sp.]
MKKLTQSFLLLFAVLTTTITFTQCKDAKDAAITKFLELQAKAVNSQCPMDMGNGIRVDSCKVEGNKILKSYYTFTVDTGELTREDFEAQTRPNLVQMIKTNNDLKQGREFEVTFAYVYYGKDGNVLGDMVITADDYNK